MKEFRSSQLSGLLALGITVCLLASCAPKKPLYEISSKYSKGKYKRVALLVVRVGNDAHRGCPVPITPETDYAVRKPQVYGEFNAIAPGNNVAKVDVYIEDEDRLRQSLPTYPDYPLHGFTEKVKYYKNITPHIYGTVSGVLDRKGYQVVNAKEVAATWPRKIPEMKVGEIVDALKKDADAILILHYADVGYYYGSAGGYSNEIKGFVDFTYTAVMFDANTKESLMYLRIDSPYLDTIPRMISEDRQIKSDPERARKIRMEGSRDPSGSGPFRYSVGLSFTEDEIIGFVMGYMDKGVPAAGVNGEPDARWWIGLDEAIP